MACSQTLSITLTEIHLKLILQVQKYTFKNILYCRQTEKIGVIVELQYTSVKISLPYSYVIRYTLIVST